jgi:hypothetical protein
MTDPDLLSRAITVSRLGTHGFALDILDVREKKVSGWLSGEHRLPMVVRALCIAIIRRPALLSEIIQSRNDNE